MSDQNKNTFRYSVRLLAGGYLCYLAYTLFQGGSDIGAAKYLFSALFFLFGVFFLISGIRAFREMKKEADRISQEGNPETDSEISSGTDPVGIPESNPETSEDRDGDGNAAP